jgi:hypothetical protein
MSQEALSHTISQLNGEQWGEVSEAFHQLVFSHQREKTTERVTGAFVDMDSTGRPFGFATYIELDDATVYLQFGGVIGPRQKTPKSYKRFVAFVEELQTKYEFIKTKVSSKNSLYIMMCLKAGFRINGVEVVGQDNEPLVCLNKVRGE